VFDGSQGTYPACASGDAVCPNIHAFADFLAGYIQSSGIAVGNAERKVVVNGFNFFGQDAWQVTPRLNPNLGLRWDYFGPLHNGTKDLAVFVPSAGGLKIQGNGIGAIFPGDKNNFAPRLGFAYQPTAKNDIVVRGGIGVFYDQINMNPFLDFRRPTVWKTTRPGRIRCPPTAWDLSRHSPVESRPALLGNHRLTSIPEFPPALGPATRTAAPRFSTSSL
jgi:hypothetical protein